MSAIAYLLTLRYHRVPHNNKKEEGEGGLYVREFNFAGGKSGIGKKIQRAD